MDDFAPLQGVDITAHLRDARGFGVTSGRAPDGVPTIEFTTDPAVHGPHGHIDARHAGVAGRRLTADVEFSGRGRAACASDDSIRIWGRFVPEATVVVMSAGPVRLVARTPDGDVLAGPVTISADAGPVELSW